MQNQRARNKNEAFMKSYPLIILAVVGACALVPAAQLRGASGASAPIPTSATSPAFVPGLDDLMTMLIQPRHIKLYYAAVQHNWELSASESRELRGSFRRIVQAVPRYLDDDVNETLTAIILPKMDAVDAAIASADEKKFFNAYAGLTAACNACHSYMQHPFLIIKVPEGEKDNAYADQLFRGGR
jgi:hypothetical protein